MTWSHNAKWLSTNVDQWELRRRLGRRSTGNAVVGQYNGRGERGSIEPQSSGDCRVVPRHMADERLAWHIDRQRLVHPLGQTPLGDLGKRPQKCRLARRPRHATGPTAAATPGSPRACRSDAKSSEGPTRPLRERPAPGRCGPPPDDPHRAASRRDSPPHRQDQAPPKKRPVRPKQGTNHLRQRREQFPLKPMPTIR